VWASRSDTRRPRAFGHVDLDGLLTFDLADADANVSDWASRSKTEHPGRLYLEPRLELGLNLISDFNRAFNEDLPRRSRRSLDEREGGRMSILSG